MVCYSHVFKNFPQSLVIHTVKVLGIVNKSEVDVFLELSHFFDDPMDVGNLISGSLAFSKSSLSLGREDPLEKEMAAHSSILVWRITWTEELGGL